MYTNEFLQWKNIRTGIFMHINTPPPPNLLNFKNNATKQKKTE